MSDATPSSMFRLGTYRLSDENLPLIVKSAYAAGVRHFDTAGLYKNYRLLGKVLNEIVQGNEIVYVTTKYWHKKDRPMEYVMAEIMAMVDAIKLNSSNIRVTVLLHHPCALYVWQSLEELYFNQFIDGLGVSNHSVEAIESIMKIARLRPQLNQIEIHPYVPHLELQSLLTACANWHIHIEAHSVLAQMIYKENPVAYLVQFALSQPGVVRACIKASSEEHLMELLKLSKLSQLAQLNTDLLAYSGEQKITQRLYPLKPAADANTAIKTYIPTLSSLIRDEIYEHKRHKSANADDITNNTILGFKLAGFIPCVKNKYSDLGKKVARYLYQDCETERESYHKYHANTKFARVGIEAKIKEQIIAASGKSFCTLKPKAKRDFNSNTASSSSFSDAILIPTPMPVTVSPLDQLMPIFDALRANEPTIASNITFYKGALTPGALDLCKQVVGEHVNDLCEALKDTDQIEHFKAGNCIMFKNSEDVRSIASIIEANKPPIKTWYLAGNCLDEKGAHIMAEALKKNNVAEAIWLKRNPIGPNGLQHIVGMLGINKFLKVLDLDNCGLLDEGARILSELKNTSITEWYLDANGFTAKGGAYLAEFIKNNIDTIQTFYASINRFEDEGAIKLIDAASESKVLLRFSLASNRLTDVSASKLHAFAMKLPQLISLDVGYYKSTFDMGEKPNFIEDPEPFIRIIEEHPNLQYLDLNMNSMTEHNAFRMVHAAKKRNTMNVYASMLNSVKISYEAIVDKNTQKYIKHSRYVDNIASQYRNKDGGQ